MNFSFVAQQIKKLVPQRIVVKTTWSSDRPWSAIFSVIVYSLCCSRSLSWFWTMVSTPISYSSPVEFHQKSDLEVLWRNSSSFWMATTRWKQVVAQGARLRPRLFKLEITLHSPPQCLLPENPERNPRAKLGGETIHFPSIHYWRLA